MRRQLNRASTLPAKNVLQQVPARRAMNRRSTLEGANLEAGGDQAVASASVVVVARIRPKLPKENTEPDGVEVYPDGQTMGITNGREKKQYTLDQVFDSRALRLQTARSDNSTEKSPRPVEQRRAEAAESQAQFFSNFGRSLVTASLTGYNVCVFAYGHTGSGKTYTMLGDAAGSNRGAAAGLLPRFLWELFSEHEDAPRPDTWRCTCEFFEVYNEQIRDLLQPGGTSQKPKKVHCHPKHGARIEGLTLSVVSSAEEVMELLNFGNQMRTVAATTMNSRSSRSHAFFNFKYEQLPEAAPKEGRERRVTIQEAPISSCQSAVTFVDLAGREDRERLGNQPGAIQYKEMCFINTSLFHLAHLITKISSGGIERGNLSDFRNSKVTMLLSQALQGNSRTAVVATLSPCQSAFEDSMSTLNFAASAKKIQTKPVVNSKSVEEKLVELENEVHSLQMELAQSKTSNTEKESELLSAQSWINYYKRSWEEACQRSEQSKLARTRSAKRLGLAQSGKGSLASLSCSVKSEEDDKDDDDLGYPYLTKLCDDPALQGCCNFPLDESLINIGSCEGSCDIVLVGVGITPEMCSVRCSKGNEVTVEALPSEDGSSVRVLLNGQFLRPEQPQPMHHGDCLILGYSHAFRLVEPSPERIKVAGTAESLQVARSTIPKLDVASAFEEAVEVEGKQLEDSGGLVSAFSFISNLSKRASEPAVRGFLSALHRVHPLVEEANVITREVFGNADLHLEIQTLTDVLDFNSDSPEIVICCLEKPSPLARFQQTVSTVQQCLRNPAAPTSSQDLADKRWMLGCAKHPLAHAMGLDEHMTIRGHGHLLSIWSLEEFLQRLSEIRDLYQEACETGEGFEGTRSTLAAQPFQNPWHQCTFSHMKVLAEEAASIRTSPLLRWLLRSPPKAPIQQAPPPGASIAGAIAQSSWSVHADLKRRPSVPESSPSACSSSHLFPVGGGDKDKPTPRTGFFEVDNSPLPTMTSYLKGLLTDPSSADVQLAVTEPCEGQEPMIVPAHSIILTRLPFFRRLIADHRAIGKSPIIVPHALSVIILRQLLVYAYTDSVKEATATLSPNMLRQLQKAASNCGMPELCKACCQKLTESSETGKPASASPVSSGHVVKRRISNASSQPQVRPAASSDSRGLPVLLSKKSSLSESSAGGSTRLKNPLGNDKPEKHVRVGSDLKHEALETASSNHTPLCLESNSSIGASPMEGRDSENSRSKAVRLSSGSLRAFADEMSELRRILLAQPKAEGLGNVPKRATELLEDLQMSMMETIRNEFKGLKEAQEEKQSPENASLSSLAVGITSQIHNLRDDLLSILHSNGSQGSVCSSTRNSCSPPPRIVAMPREESPPAARVVGQAATAPVSGFSTEPVVRPATASPTPDGRLSPAPPLSQNSLPNSLPCSVPGSVMPSSPHLRMSKPLQQRLVVTASTGQLPAAGRSPSPPSMYRRYVVPSYQKPPGRAQQATRPTARSMSPLPRTGYLPMAPRGRHTGWMPSMPVAPVSVRWSPSPRQRTNISSATTIHGSGPFHSLQEPVAVDPRKAPAPAAAPARAEVTKPHAARVESVESLSV